MNKNTIAIIMLMIALAGSCSTLYVFIEDKNQEVLDLKFEAIEKELSSFHQEQDRQWKVINNNSQK